VQDKLLGVGAKEAHIQLQIKLERKGRFQCSKLGWKVGKIFWWFVCQIVGRNRG